MADQNQVMAKIRLALSRCWHQGDVVAKSAFAIMVIMSLRLLVHHC